jgi:hypothetical protein
MFKKKFMEILQSLGFVEKAKKEELTEDDWTQIDAAFKEKFGKTLSEAQAENENIASNEADRKAALDIINAVTAEDKSESDDDEDEGDEEKPEKPKKKAIVQDASVTSGVQTLVTKMDALTSENKKLQEQIEKMAKIANPDTAETVVRKLNAAGPGHTDKHLFGIQHAMFALENRWNKIARNPNEAKLSEPSKEDFVNFQSHTYKYGQSVGNRYRYLKENNMLDQLKKGSTFLNDTTELADAGLGDQYVILRQDALIARILSIPTPYDLFPRRYGVQDRELMTTVYFDELSQAYQAGKVFKGGMKLQPEMAYVDDAMFKAEFGPMKEIERQYIGYLNSEGSDPMKWSMIEWQLLNMYKVLVNEQNTRVIRGCYVKPETGVAGSYLNAGTGLIYTLHRYINENKLLTHSDAAYDTYTEATMLAAVNAFLDDVISVLDEDETLDNKFIYLNKRHQSWWIKNIRTTLGKDTDFKGPEGYLNRVPDYDVKIKWVPNLGDSKLMFIQEHGNLQAIEFVPGEMLKVDFDKAMELMHVWSTWKEGFSAFIVGKKFATKDLLKANNYAQQQIFMNTPATSLAADATTVDGSLNYWFITGINTKATEITDITNPKRGVVYKIEIGNAAFPSNIKKALKFAGITDDWDPTDVNDYIMVTLMSNNTFMELERCEAGVRTINTAAQPNIIGGR